MRYGKAEFNHELTERLMLIKAVHPVTKIIQSGKDVGTLE
nr:MAG TPA: hypothetical protein [Caudoviricetes sp.]